jgi:hypothetical protein
MDMLNIYYYTSIPLVTCNMLFYSISTLSTSIISSQNVVKFISQHKDCDSVLFQNEMEMNDITNKLKIVDSLVFDMLKKYCNNKEEFEIFKDKLLSPVLLNEEQDFTVVELKMVNKNMLERIDEPIKYALLSTVEITQQLHNTLINCNNKINNYKNSYVKNIITLSLKNELCDFKKQTNILDKRLNLLLELLKIYVKN